MSKKKKETIVEENKPEVIKVEPYTEPRNYRVGQKVKFMHIYGNGADERGYREGIIVDVQTIDAYKTHVYSIATSYDQNEPLAVVPESWIKEN